MKQNKVETAQDRLRRLAAEVDAAEIEVAGAIQRKRDLQDQLARAEREVLAEIKQAKEQGQ